MTSRFLFRVLRDDETLENGIMAKNSKANKTVAYHVNQYSEKNFEDTQYISTTSDLEIAIKLLISKKHFMNNPVLCIIDIKSTTIDMSNKIIDLNNELIRQLCFPDNKYKKAKEYAKKVNEVLILESIPSECILGCWDYKYMQDFCMSNLINVSYIESFIWDSVIDFLIEERKYNCHYD